MTTTSAFHEAPAEAPPAPDPAALASPVTAVRPIPTPPATRLRSWPPDTGRQPPGPPAAGCFTQGAFTQGALALSFALPGGLPAEPCSPLGVATGTCDGGQDSAAGSSPDVPVPDVHQWSGRFLQAVIEVIGCDRPLSQLIRWTDGRVYADIEQRQRFVARARQGQPARPGRNHVATIRVCRPTADAAEVSARVITGIRSRAVAARLDLHRGRWLCTALQFG